MSDIRLGEGAEDIAFAGMLADLIRQNLAQDPRKSVDFKKLSTTVFIRVTDADVSVSLCFARGSLVVYRGAQGKPGISVATTADLVLALCMLRVVNGMPRIFHRDSRALVRNILRGAVRISGLGRHPIQMLRFSRLMSVNGGPTA